MFKVPEEYRAGMPKGHQLYSEKMFGNNGLFFLRDSHENIYLCIASDQGFPGQPAWEHVSVTLRNQERTPTWEEMCFIKSVFWNENDTVLQYHPAKSEYVDYSPWCLHLWRPIGIDFPKPDSRMIGPK